MKKYKYVVKDSLNNIMRVFPTYKQAETYRFVRGNNQWTIQTIKD